MNFYTIKTTGEQCQGEAGMCATPFISETGGGLSRWWKNKTWRSPASHKYIQNTFACGATPTEHLLNAGISETGNAGRNSRRKKLSLRQSIMAENVL